MSFNPCMINSGCLFNKFAIFGIKCNSNVLAFCAIATIILPQGRDSRRYNNPRRIVSERGFSLNASHAVTAIFHTFALRTELFHADQIRYVYCCLFRLPRILRGLKVVKYVQNLFAVGGHRVLQRCHVTQVSFSVLAAVLKVSLFHS